MACHPKSMPPLAAFNDLAQVAGSNTAQLAQAYNGAKAAIGDNAQGLAELDKALNQAVGDSTALADGVKALATEQQNAKNATDEQQKALQALGVEMDAINAGMSASGQKMAESLKVGISAIKETATSATALKTALQTAFDSAINSAKTVEDFKAIDAAITAAGVSAQLSSTQMQALNQGMAGNAKAASVQAAATKTAAAAQSTQTTTTTANTAAIKDNTAAKKENAAASTEAAQSTNKMAQGLAKTISGTPLFVASFQNKIGALREYGVNAEQIGQVNKSLFNTLMSIALGANKNAEQTIYTLNKQIQAVKDASTQVDEYSKALSSASVSAHDLQKAQSALNNATHTTINGIEVMDKARLDNLKRQIDQARAKMQGLAEDAKNTADSLESELARIQGNDKRALEIENTKKLADLENKLAQARQRSNTQEIKELERALELQRQINSAKLSELDRQRQEKQAQAQQNAGKATNTKSNSTQDGSARQTSAPSASEVAGAFGAAIDQARRGAVNDFAKQLMSEAKRMAR